MANSTPHGAGSTADQVLAGIDLSRKHILITGCSGGIGFETMSALAANGARIIGLARSLAIAKMRLRQGWSIRNACRLRSSRSRFGFRGGEDDTCSASSTRCNHHQCRHCQPTDTASAVWHRVAVPRQPYQSLLLGESAGGHSTRWQRTHRYREQRRKHQSGAGRRHHVRQSGRSSIL